MGVVSVDLSVASLTGFPKFSLSLLGFGATEGFFTVSERSSPGLVDSFGLARLLANTAAWYEGEAWCRPFCDVSRVGFLKGTKVSFFSPWTGLLPVAGFEDAGNVVREGEGCGFDVLPLPCRARLAAPTAPLFLALTEALAFKWEPCCAEERLKAVVAPRRAALR
jgi:hypothetical protein